MGVKDGFGRVMSKASQIALISALLAIGVGIGSLLTQYQMKLPLDFALAAQLMIIFFVIMAFGGAVFSMISRRPTATR